MRRPAVPLGAVFTLVLWSGSLAVGLLGFAVPYPRPIPAPEESSRFVAKALEVELTSDPLPPVEPPMSPDFETSEPPPLLDPLPPSDAPPMTPVAEPTSAIAFALPVEGPVRIVEARDAAHVRPIEPVASKLAPSPPLEALTFGQGEGRQPAPEYPRHAIREGQEGTVTIRFSVAESGRVIAAEAVRPCPWPFLNAAALRTVRERWRFAAGRVRLYEVAIRFQLTK